MAATDRIVYRPLQPGDDVEAITALLHEAYAPLAAAGMRFYASHQDAAATRTRMEAGETFVATDGDRIVGIITLRDAATTGGSPFYDRPGVASFGQFAVRPEYQRRGIGSRLIELVEARARAKGVIELGLDTAETAARLIAFYERKGYRFVEPVCWPEVNYRSRIYGRRLTMTDARWPQAPALWQQFGAAIDTLENGIRACPEPLWGDRSRRPEYWYLVYHTLFYLDYYLAESPRDFAPPTPYTLGELEDGVMPDRVYTKDEMLAYLRHGRDRCRSVIAALTPERADAPCGFPRKADLTVVALMMYNMRHVQHHAAQLNLILRQTIDSATPWVSRAGTPLETGPSAATGARRG